MNSKEDVLGVQRNQRKWRRWCSSLAVFGAVSVWGSLAGAQPIAFQNTRAERFPDDRSSTEALRWYINRDECNTEDAYFRFNVSVTGWDLNENFEVWATTKGAQCTSDEQRTGINPQCVQLKPKSQVTRNGTNPQTFSLEFPVTELVNVEKGLGDDCGATSDNVTLRQLVIYFMLTTSGQFVTGSDLKWDKTQIDMWGPAAPTSVEVTPGEASVELTPSGTVEAQSTVVAYCAKDGQILNGEETTDNSSCSCSGVGNESAGGSAGSSAANGGSAGSAGAAGAGGMGGAGGAGGSGGSGGSQGSGSACNDLPLVSGQLPNSDWTPCADGSTVVSDLENNQTYAIAVAYRDNVGNIGKLSPVVCATPSPIEDFFENYNREGGAAGGGFCSISHRTLRNTSFGASFALAALALIGRRRTRLSRNASSKEVSK